VVIMDVVWYEVKANREEEIERGLTLRGNTDDMVRI